MVDVCEDATDVFLASLQERQGGYLKAFLDFIDNCVEEYKYPKKPVLSGRTVVNIEQGVYSSFEYTKQLFTFLNDWLNQYNANFNAIHKTIYFDIKEDITSFMKFINIYFKCNTITHFFNFNWYISCDMLQ